MLTRLIIVITFLPFWLFAQQKIDYRVPGKIPELKQPKDMDCWITTATMMLSWRDQENYSIDDALNYLSDTIWHHYYENNIGLQNEEQEKFVQALGLREEPPANYMLEAYVDFLKSYGPLWITTGHLAHARVLVGVKGDGSYENSSCIFIDPISGKEKDQNALEFVLEFEKEARLLVEYFPEREFRIQIYHF